ncbi:hypothetical protein KOW79_011022 [Hemibagrus wyckioides]|uniref:Uncharacterized protein n=1 Tax=Hemibagrus wyckioides TaxID=337641 RepID=A0A9D3NLD9_9TELE|nr:hypothetical protein KOW79_011022 [Hemibagrus wyckioides]
MGTWADALEEEYIILMEIQLNFKGEKKLGGRHVPSSVSLKLQIYQKLKDHEMAENSTVKWAEQRDGEVFHKKKDNNIGAGNENQQRCDL